MPSVHLNRRAIYYPPYKGRDWGAACKNTKHKKEQ